MWRVSQVKPPHCRPRAGGAPHCFVKTNAYAHRTIAMAARTTAVVSFAIFFIFDVGCSWRAAVANGGSWGGCVDNAGSCGVVLKLSNRFFGALAGVRFFFGFRPRLLGIGKLSCTIILPLRAQGDAGSPVRPVAIGAPSQ